MSLLEICVLGSRCNRAVPEVQELFVEPDAREGAYRRISKAAPTSEDHIRDHARNDIDHSAECGDRWDCARHLARHTDLESVLVVRIVRRLQPATLSSQYPKPW